MTVTFSMSGYLKASKPESAQRLLEKLGRMLDLDLTGFARERYWKDESLFRFHGQVPLPDMAFRDAYFEVPMRFGGVASGRISITVPMQHSAHAWDFSGGVQRTWIAGIESLDFSVVKSTGSPPDHTFGESDETSAEEVFALWHTHEFGEDDEDVKFLGVYSTRELAEASLAALRAQPGFRDAPDGFHVSCYRLNEKLWTEGYATIPHEEDESLG